jgi:predicted lipoprotein with Yx(FWY)xxD motif
MKTSRSSRRRLGAVAGAGLLAVAAAVATMAAMAAARSATLTAARVHLTGPSGARTETIAVTGRGVSVYWLGGESAHHLLCKTACFQFWPPLKVAAHSRPTASGFKGRLGTLRRQGFTQVTLNGHPVYTFVPDHAKRGVATGDGVVAFGGPWHVFSTGGSSAATQPAPTTSSTTTSPYPGY